MNKRPRCRRLPSAAIACWLLLPVAVFAAPSEAELSFSKSDWKIGVAQFQNRGLPPEQTHLLQALPTLLYNRLLPCSEHRINEEERSCLARRFFETKILELQKQLSAEQKKFDRLFFDREVSPQQRNSQSIQKLYLQLDQYRSRQSDSALLSIPDAFPLAWPSTGNESPVFPPLTVAVADFMKEKDLDMLITGSVEQIEGLLFYTLELYSLNAETPVFRRENGGEYQTLQALALRDSNALIETVLGQPWASLYFETEPITAAIHFNDGFKGVGIINRVYIRPGRYSLRLTAPGFINEEVEVVLKPNDEAQFHYQMQRDAAAPVVLQSFPSGADVYLSSEWKGKTPLLLQEAGRNEPFVVRLKNYTDYYGNIDEAKQGIDNFILNSSKYRNEDYLFFKRRKMYQSVTLLALGVPFFLFGFGFDAKWSAAAQTPGVPMPSGAGFHKTDFDLLSTRRALGLLSQGGLTLFTVGIIHLFADMIEYVSVFDKM